MRLKFIAERKSGPDVSTGIDAIAGLDLKSHGNSAQPDLPGPESRYQPGVKKGRVKN